MDQYQTSSWRRLHEDPPQDSEFARYLLEFAHPIQIAFQRLMSSCDGNPAGIECKSESRESWAFVLPDAAGESPWRIQNFDQNGFSGHSCYKSLELAAETMISDGYRVLDPGALDRCASTVQWAIGVKNEEVRLLCRQGKITWEEMMERMQVVTSKTGKPNFPEQHLAEETPVPTTRRKIKA